ncbi:MAG TPA: enoyl-CoA hydratase-related protein [Longimicrobiaceae bacterium]|nr:enoyl-CoA hydratase-related protein [Longimicrobiaceae bacterium]
MSYQAILTERVGAVAVIAINRPEKRNALNSTVRAELISALDELRGDEGVRVVVITGAGDHAFVAGADLGEFAERTPAEQRDAMAGRRVFEEVADFPKPVLAMINGYALGGGCELAQACDLRIAADSAKLGQPEINLAIIPGGGATQRLPRLVGMGQAMRLILSGEIITADEALRIGLVDLVYPADDLRQKTLELAVQIARKSPIALEIAKKAIRSAQEIPLADGLARETEDFLTCFASEDKQEGIAAFMEKRDPIFIGR